MTLDRLQNWWKSPWVSLVLVLAVAVLLRFFRLGSVPPGLSFDEAGNGVAALDVAAGQYRLWWPIGGGKEPLIAYLLQPLLWLFGPTPLALRLYAATMGVVSVAGTYWLAWEMFAAAPVSERDNQLRSLLPLFAALGLATAFWHVAFSRLAFRALALPAVEVLALAWLWRTLRVSESLARREAGWGRYAGVGILVGLGSYTYLAGRLVPVVLVVFFAAEAGLAWMRGVQPLALRQARGLVISALAAVLVLLPLSVFFVLHPEAFLERAGVVSIFNPEWNEGNLGGTLLGVTLTTLGTFAAVTGDPNPIANLPGRPMLGLILTLFFWLGVAVSLWCVVRYGFGRRHEPACVEGSDRLLPAAYLLLVCWWLVMLVPGILAPEGAPHHLRIIGTAPATYILVAIGLSQISTAGRVRFTAWLVVLAFLIIGLATARDYFSRWARLPELYISYDVYALELVEQMAAEGSAVAEGSAAESDTPLAYVIPMDLRAGREARHYTLDFVYQGDIPYYYLPVDETSVTDRLTEVAHGRKALRVVRWLQDKHVAADEREVVTFLLASTAQLTDEETYPAYRVETWALPSAHTAFGLPSMDKEIGVTFGDVLRLEAAHISVRGDMLAIALRWAPLAAMDADYKVSLRLVDAATGGGPVRAQKDRFLRHNWHQGTSTWPPETVNEYYLLTPVPPGKYELRVVVYHPETLAPLVTDEGVEVSLGAITVD